MCMHHLKILVWVVVNSYQKKTKKKAMMMTTDLPVRRIGHQLIVVQICEGRELPIFKRSFYCWSAFCAFDINKQKISQQFFSLFFSCTWAFPNCQPWTLNPSPDFVSILMGFLVIPSRSFVFDFILAIADRVVFSPEGGMVVELQSWVMLPSGWIQWVVSKELPWDVPFSSLLHTSP